MTLLLIRGRFGSGSAYSAVEEHGVPAWYTGGVDNKGNWWGGPNTPEMEGFYWSLVDNRAYIQYGKNRSGWAGTRFASESLTWTNEVMNDDGSVSCDVTVDVGQYQGRTTDYIIGSVPVVHTLMVGNQTVATYSGGTGDNFDVAGNPSRVTKHITVGPQSYSDDVQLYFNAHYPTGIYPDAHFTAGLTLYNPTEPSYIPMAARKNSTWNSLNDHGGHILIRQNGWQNKSKELFATQRQANRGHNRIRRNGEWLQLPKM